MKSGMIGLCGSVRLLWMPAPLLLGLGVFSGCSLNHPVEPVTVRNPVFGPITIAVAPAVNLSGSASFDRDRFADLMASELAFAEGVSVIPVSRVLGALAVEGLDGVESPSHAMDLASRVGADAMLVFAVTEYEPYEPPSIGISSQLYGRRPRPSGGAMDPISLSRKARLVGATTGGGTSRGLLSHSQAVYNASHSSIAADIREFALRRDGDDSPYGWRKYVVSQREFIRFCCHQTIRALLHSRTADEPVTESDSGTP